MRIFLRDFGIIVVAGVFLVHVGGLALEAFIDYLLRSWDLGAAILALGLFLVITQGTWRAFYMAFFMKR